MNLGELWEALQLHGDVMHKAKVKVLVEGPAGVIEVELQNVSYQPPKRMTRTNPGVIILTGGL